MSEEQDAQTTTKLRTYSWLMLLASIPVAVMGATFIANAEGWWHYVTGAVAFVWAALLIYFGVKSRSRSAR